MTDTIKKVILTKINTSSYKILLFGKRAELSISNSNTPKGMQLDMWLDFNIPYNLALNTRFKIYLYQKDSNGPDIYVFRGASEGFYYNGTLYPDKTPISLSFKLYTHEN